MNTARTKELECGNGDLTEAEKAEGWHFCLEWDGMLCHPDSPEAEVCGCPLRKGKEHGEYK